MLTKARTWYVFHIKPQRETDAKLAIKRAFGLSGADVWAPWQARVRRANRHTRALKAVHSTIPGYLFVRSHHTLQPYMVSGSDAILSMMRQDDRAVTISDAGMRSMQQAIREDAREKLRSIRKGHKGPSKRPPVKLKLADLATHPEAKQILRAMLPGAREEELEAA